MFVIGEHDRQFLVVNILMFFELLLQLPVVFVKFMFLVSTDLGEQIVDFFDLQLYLVDDGEGEEQAEDVKQQISDEEGKELVLYFGSEGHPPETVSDYIDSFHKVIENKNEIPFCNLLDYKLEKLPYFQTIAVVDHFIQKIKHSLVILLKDVSVGLLVLKDRGCFVDEVVSLEIVQLVGCRGVVGCMLYGQLSLHQVA